MKNSRKIIYSGLGLLIAAGIVVGIVFAVLMSSNNKKTGFAAIAR